MANERIFLTHRLLPGDVICIGKRLDQAHYLGEPETLAKRLDDFHDRVFLAWCQWNDPEKYSDMGDTWHGLDDWYEVKTESQLAKETKS